MQRSRLRICGLFVVLAVVVAGVVVVQLQSGVPAAAVAQPASAPPLAVGVLANRVPGDFFGCSIATDGRLALIGAMGDQTGGVGSGCAYLYDISDPSSAVQLARIEPTGAVQNQGFGWHVAVRGDLVAVSDGAKNANGGQWSVHLYRLDPDGQAVHITQIKAGAGEYYLQSIEMDGGLLLVGLLRTAAGKTSSESLVCVYDISQAAHPVRVSEIGSGKADGFGCSIAVDGSLALIGAHSAGITDKGCAYLYDLTDPAKPVLMSKISPKGVGWGGGFGTTVALGDGLALIGGFGGELDDFPGGARGVAHLYDISDQTVPERVAKLERVIRNPYAEDYYCYSVALYGDAAIVGTIGDVGNRFEGAVSVIDLSDPAHPVLRQTLAERGVNRFGNFVTASDGVIVVGARGDNARWDPDGGSAHLYVR